MSVANIKTNNQGFTIVELLIVVVVIAILAAITIVSYNGITNRANASSAQSAAAGVQKKVELYYADQGRYPIATTELTTADKPWTTDSGVFGTADPTATTGKNYVRVQACKSNTSALSATNITGIRISWYDYQKSSSQITTLDSGTNCSTTANLSNLN